MSDDSDVKDGRGEEPAPYDPPGSQAELDRIISDRIQRERAKYSDYADLKKAAKRLEEIEASNKSEMERISERAATAEARVVELEKTAQVAAWKQQVSESSGVPTSVLAGSTLEELEAHAERVKALMPTDTPSRVTGPYVPIEGTGSGRPKSTRDQFAEVLGEALNFK